MWPHRWQPTRLPCPWDSSGKSTRVGCHRLLRGICVMHHQIFPSGRNTCPTISFSNAGKWKVKVKSLCCVWSPPGSSVHGISQARVLEWGAIAFSGKEPLVSLNNDYSLGMELWKSPHFILYLPGGFQLLVFIVIVDCWFSRLRQNQGEGYEDWSS